MIKEKDLLSPPATYFSSEGGEGGSFSLSLGGLVYMGITSHIVYGIRTKYERGI